MSRHRGEKGAILGLGALAGIAGGTWKFLEFTTKVKKLHDVGSENAVFVRLLANVRADVRETERLLHLREVKAAMATNPEKVRWIRETISRMRTVMEEMARHTERVEGDMERRKWGWFGGAHVGFRHRLRWLLDEYEKLVHRRMELAMAHQSLLAVMEFLGQFEPLACCQKEGERKVRIDVEREIFDERNGRRERFEDEKEEFVDVRRRGLVDDKDRDFVDARRRTVIDERDERDERDRAFVKGREERIEMVDLEQEEDTRYGRSHGGGHKKGARSRSNELGAADYLRPRRAYDFDTPDNRTSYREERFDVRDGNRDSEIIREKRIYKERPERDDRTVSTIKAHFASGFANPTIYRLFENEGNTIVTDTYGHTGHRVACNISQYEE